MQAIVHNRKKAADGSISFPALHCWNPETETATIAAQVSGKRVSCKITYAVIKRRFNVLSETPMETVATYRKEIEAAARLLIENKRYAADGSINITYDDL